MLAYRLQSVVEQWTMFHLREAIAEKSTQLPFFVRLKCGPEPETRDYWSQGLGRQMGGLRERPEIMCTTKRIGGGRSQGVQTCT